MIKFFKLLPIFFINILGEKIILQVENEETAFVEGLIKIQQNQSMFIVQFKKMNILETNEICSRLGYLKLHSVQSPFQLNSSIQYIIDLNFKVIEILKMLTFFVLK